MNKRGDFVKTVMIGVIYILLAVAVSFALFFVYRSFA